MNTFTFRYNVDVVYTELQSFQERGSTWCVTFPPRCSTYRIKHRVVNKTKTIAKNRIVRDCCGELDESGCLTLLYILPFLTVFRWLHRERRRMRAALFGTLPAR